jgi:diguanylate cyclase (GGDEF)-like protein
MAGLFCLYLQIPTIGYTYSYSLTMQSDMPSLPPEHIQKIIFQGIDLTDDCLGVFDDKDILVFCNENLAKIFDCTTEQALNKSFDDLIRHCYLSPGGVHIETDDVEQWIRNANKKRRSKCFRAFETDLKDGRWVLVTEQLVEDQYIFMYCSDITEKKQYEFEIKKKSEELFTLATTDSLTKVYTRRHFYQQAERELSRCQREGTPCSLLMVDLDHFKAINDQYGHGGGDKVLASFSDNAHQYLRDYDLIGRLGGEEFAILLPDTAAEKAIAIAERLRSSCEQLDIHYQNASIKLTASIGISVTIGAQLSFDQLVRQADQNLYQAKTTGRNQIYFSGSET